MDEYNHDQEYNLPCKSCGLLYSKTSILKHINQQKILSCKTIYSTEEIQDLEKQSKEIQKRKRNLRDRVNYDPEKRKKKYDPKNQKLLMILLRGNKITRRKRIGSFHMKMLRQKKTKGIWNGEMF